MHDIKMSCQDKICMCALLKGTMQTTVSVCVCDATQFEGLINYLKKSQKKSESSRAASTHTNTHTHTHTHTNTCCSDSLSPARDEIVHSSSPTWIINLDCMCMQVYNANRICVCVCRDCKVRCGKGAAIISSNTWSNFRKMEKARDAVSEK